MNGKKAKQIRRNAKYIYDVKTSYNDVRYKVEELIPVIDPETGEQVIDPLTNEVKLRENPAFFMNDALAKRTLKEGTTRKMSQDLKRGYKSKMVTASQPRKGWFGARKMKRNKYYEWLSELADIKFQFEVSKNNTGV